MTKHRWLICSFTALMSGAFGFYVGGQISLSVHSYECHQQPWGLSTLCQMKKAPASLWRGSTTGVWMGTLLGAFVAGVATKKRIEINDQ